MTQSTLASTWKRRWRRALKDIGSQTIYRLDETFGRASLLGDHVFFDPSSLPWTARLEAHTTEIRRELIGLLGHMHELPAFQEISPDQKSLTNDQQWKTFFLVGFGVPSAAAAQLCPQTLSLVRDIPGVVTAFFSILAPGKKIPMHRGPYKGLLRYHLGLIVPQEARNCTITVNDETRHWEEGRSLLFDDRHPHHVHNNTNEARVVLFVDVRRPLPSGLDRLNQGVIKLITASPYVQDGVARQREWEKHFLEGLTPHRPSLSGAEATRLRTSDVV